MQEILYDGTDDEDYVIIENNTDNIDYIVYDGDEEDYIDDLLTLSSLEYNTNPEDEIEDYSSLSNPDLSEDDYIDYEELASGLLFDSESLMIIDQKSQELTLTHFNYDQLKETQYLADRLTQEKSLLKSTNRQLSRGDEFYEKCFNFLKDDVEKIISFKVFFTSDKYKASNNLCKLWLDELYKQLIESSIDSSSLHVKGFINVLKDVVIEENITFDIDYSFAENLIKSFIDFVTSISNLLKDDKTEIIEDILRNSLIITPASRILPFGYECPCGEFIETPRPPLTTLIVRGSSRVKTLTVNSVVQCGSCGSLVSMPEEVIDRLKVYEDYVKNLEFYYKEPVYYRPPISAILDCIPDDLMDYFAFNIDTNMEVGSNSLDNSSIQGIINQHINTIKYYNSVKAKDIGDAIKNKFNYLICDYDLLEDYICFVGTLVHYLANISLFPLTKGKRALYNYTQKNGIDFVPFDDDFITDFLRDNAYILACLKPVVSRENITDKPIDIIEEFKDSIDYIFMLRTFVKTRNKSAGGLLKNYMNKEYGKTFMNFYNDTVNKIIKDTDHKFRYTLVDELDIEPILFRPSSYRNFNSFYNELIDNVKMDDLKFDCEFFDGMYEVNPSNIDIDSYLLTPPGDIDNLNMLYYFHGYRLFLSDVIIDIEELNYSKVVSLLMDKSLLETEKDPTRKNIEVLNYNFKSDVSDLKYEQICYLTSHDNLPDELLELRDSKSEESYLKNAFYLIANSDVIFTNDYAIKLFEVIE